MKKSTLKKLTAIVLSVCTCIGATSLCTQAAVKPPAENLPQYTAIAKTSNLLEHLGNGKLTVYGATSVYDGYNASVYVELQKYNNGWRYVNSWSDSDYSFAVVDTTYYVTTGAYRLKLTHKSYTSGWSQLDNVTKYSDTVYVP